MAREDELVPSGPGGTMLARIEALLAVVERENPRIGALSEVLAADARSAARRLDALTPQARAALPLAGVPVVVKDLIDTPPAACRGGLSVFDDWHPGAPAAVVRRLREAGAIVVGVGATDHAGFGVRTGQVAHPLLPGRTVGGSSGGCAAAVAAGWVAAAIGTDTGGSIRIPAACCGVVGFKPTWARVPTEGVRALVPSLDHVGPIAASVADARAITRMIDPRFAGEPEGAGAAPPGGTGVSPPGGTGVSPPGWASGARGSSVEDRPWHALRIGVASDLVAASDPAVSAAVEAAIERLRALGAQVSTVVLPGDPLLEQVHETVFCYEAARAWAAVIADPRRFVALPALVRDTLLAGLQVTVDEYRAAMVARAGMRAEVDHCLDRVDLILLPTLPVPPPPVQARRVMLRGRETGFTSALIRFTRLFDHTGHPALALPLPSAGSCVASLQLAAGTGRDAWLLDAGAAIEASLSLGARRSPAA